MEEELIKALKEYIELLEGECSRFGAFAIGRAWMRSSQEDIDKGIELRARIKELEK